MIVDHTDLESAFDLQGNGDVGNDRFGQTQFDADVVELFVLKLGDDPLQPQGTSYQAGDDIGLVVSGQTEQKYGFVDTRFLQDGRNPQSSSSESVSIFSLSFSMMTTSCPRCSRLLTVINVRVLAPTNTTFTLFHPPAKPSVRIQYQEQSHAFQTPEQHVDAKYCFEKLR